MPELSEEVIRRLLKLEATVQRLQVEKKKFEILNSTRIFPASDQNNWDIPDVDNLVVEATVAAVAINGIANGVNGRVLFVQNTLAGTTLTFTHNNAAASAGNKILTPTAGSIVVAAGSSMLAVYTYQVGLTDYAWRIYWTS